MAGLNSLLSNTAQTTTSLPSWYDTAQQKIVSGATGAYGAAPAASATVGQKAVDLLSGTTNPFTTATNTLQGIATGAASPWITDAAGNVTPNTSTALGGLFAAQNKQLQQSIPGITATPTASGIGSGQFGSLRTQTAADKAIADAQANLFADQMKAALQSQQTGVSAAQGVGTLTNQQLQDLLTTGQYQQAAPFTNVANLTNVIKGVQAPTTVSSQTQLSPLNQVGALTSLLGGSTTDNLLKSLGIPGGLSSLSSWFSGTPSADSAVVSNYLDSASTAGTTNPWTDPSYTVPAVDTSGVTAPSIDPASAASALGSFFG